MRKFILVLFSLFSLFIFGCSNVVTSPVPENNNQNGNPEQPSYPEIPDFPDITPPANVTPYKHNISIETVKEGEADYKPDYIREFILLQIEKEDGTKENRVMKFNGPDDWSEGKGLYGYGGFTHEAVDWDNVKSATATFSSYYTINGENNFGYKVGDFETDGDNYPGKWDMPSGNVEIDKDSKTVTINLTKDYGCLKIKTNPYQRSKINITNFRTPDNFIDWPFPSDSNDKNYSQTIRFGKDGYVYLYGKWENDSKIQLIYKEHGKLKQITKELPPFTKEITEVDLSYDKDTETVPDGEFDVKIYDNYWDGYVFPGAIAQGSNENCWAASSSQLIAKWATNTGRGYDYPKLADTIYGSFTLEIGQGGFRVDDAIRWYVRGDKNGKTASRIKQNGNGYYNKGGNFNDYGVDAYTYCSSDFYPLRYEIYETDKKTGQPKGTDFTDISLKEFSEELYFMLKSGMPVLLSDTSPHATLIQGAHFKDGLVTQVMLTDSAANYVYDHGYEEYNYETGLYEKIPPAKTLGYADVIQDKNGLILFSAVAKGMEGSPIDHKQHLVDFHTIYNDKKSPDIEFITKS